MNKIYITQQHRSVNPLRRQPHEMVKHTQTICRQFADEQF